jgi:Trypsin-like peptidase domain
MASDTRFALSRRGLLLSAASLPFASKAHTEDALTGVSPKTALIPSEQLIHSTALIETLDEKGIRSSGTGFFFSFFRHGTTSVEAIITNRHVLQNASSVFVTLTVSKDGLPQFAKTKRLQLLHWLFHPDPTIDLAMIAIWPELGPLVATGETFMMVASEPSLVPTDAELHDLMPLEDVLIVGYPDGISDGVNNVPVFRRGITATPVYLDFQGKPQFLLDAAIFPGSSGSPVFLFNQGTWSDRAGHVVMGARLRLLGIVFAVAQHKSDGQIVIRPAPTQSLPSVETLIPNNIGLCVKAAKVLDFEPLLLKLGVAALPDGYTVRSTYQVP